MIAILKPIHLSLPTLKFHHNHFPFFFIFNHLGLAVLFVMDQFMFYLCYNILCQDVMLFVK